METEWNETRHLWWRQSFACISFLCLHFTKISMIFLPAILTDWLTIWHLPAYQEKETSWPIIHFIHIFIRIKIVRGTAEWFCLINKFLKWGIYVFLRIIIIINIVLLTPTFKLSIRYCTKMHLQILLNSHYSFSNYFLNARVRIQSNVGKFSLIVL